MTLIIMEAYDHRVDDGDDDDDDDDDIYDEYIDDDTMMSCSYLRLLVLQPTTS